jgi:hypothetical protein
MSDMFDVVKDVVYDYPGLEQAGIMIGIEPEDPNIEFVKGVDRRNLNYIN